MLEIFQIDRADQASDADLHHVGLAVMDGDDIDPAEFQAFIDSGHVLLITGNAIERFHHHDIKSACLGVRDQPHEAVTLDHGRA
ncbi:hypothetical protein EN851_11295 [Mesorhizobium sp. M8A.F.Ca.ET.208.01.1.1]|uniref:hypothetical protein n=1 Tax=unclassified Mesorhizobium TaxID=325217 RepID=UPI0010937DC5|nr:MULTISPECIES: hypothetical protein [unclassified Mesorhizobium]TGQ92177.1 hypothetical protein EN851_11295 [Mesorhizobium sp. M8A.F.Ca.ET.208.01.1.1]TGT52077.1 hypothetical protein EN810_11285 [Mesorhizobium sp. M8A.F.Ca.ET.167.01.1.1]